MIEAGPKSSSSPDTDPYQYHGIVARVAGHRYKYVERDSGAKELYDLTADPSELDNRAGQEAYADVQSQMVTLLATYEWCAGAQCQ